MAHQTDVNQVPKNFDVPVTSERVTDPVCGKTMLRKDAHFALFRGTQQFHFCSKSCRDEFLKPRFRSRPGAGTSQAA